MVVLPEGRIELHWFFFIIYDNSRNFVENMTIFKKLLYLNMTISVWQTFWKFSKYENLQNENFFFYFQKYDNPHYFAFLRCFNLYYIFHSTIFQPLKIVIPIWNMTIWIWQYFEKFSNMTISNMLIILKLTYSDFK